MEKNKIKRLADYAVRQCCENSDNCYWSVSYDELYHHFGVEITDSNESAKLIEKELRQREEINELIMTEDAIEMTCHLRYCPQCQGDPVSLFSVLGCNLYDDHETEHNHEPANESSDEDETQMGKIFFTGDLHFGHANVIAFDNRPFKTVEEMDAELIRRWNSKVGKGDLTYVLGDMIWKARNDDAPELNQKSKRSDHSH